MTAAETALPGRCPHRPPCPGCPRLGEPGIAPVALAALQSLASRHGLRGDVPVVSGAPTGFRHRARLAIRGLAGSPQVGMFELGTHRVVPIPQCLVHHPAINRVAQVVGRALAETRASIYDEATHRGHARYLQVVVERASGAAQVVLVGNVADASPLADSLDLVRDRLGDDLHSLWLNFNGQRTNAILGPAFERWCGPPSVVERFGGPPVHFPPGAFGQNNLDVAERIVGHLRAAIPSGAHVAEFYAGVGAIGLSLLPRVGTLRMNEVSPASLQGLDMGLAALAPDERARIDVVPGPARNAVDALSGADVVIADPPRKGLDRELIDGLVTRPPGLFLYVSCGLESFLRDVEHLTASGSLRLARIAAFDLMPYTDHVETVASFERA